MRVLQKPFSSWNRYSRQITCVFSTAYTHVAARTDHWPVDCKTRPAPTVRCGSVADIPAAFPLRPSRLGGRRAADQGREPEGPPPGAQGWVHILYDSRDWADVVLQTKGGGEVEGLPPGVQRRVHILYSSRNWADVVLQTTGLTWKFTACCWRVSSRMLNWIQRWAPSFF